jgi:hypothetical protein
VDAGSDDERLPTGDPIDVEIETDLSERGNFHPWYARRRYRHAFAAVAAALAPRGTLLPDLKAAVSVADTERTCRLLTATRSADLSRVHVVDMCAGTGTVSMAAAALGCSATAIESQPVPHLVARLLLQDVRRISGWGDPKRRDQALTTFMREVRKCSDFLHARAEEALQQPADISADLVAQIWARFSRCGSCGCEFPLLSDTRITKDAFIQLRHDLQGSNGRVVGVSRAQTTGTYHRGIGTCPRCEARVRVGAVTHIAARPLITLWRTESGHIDVRPALEAGERTASRGPTVGDIWAPASDRHSEIRDSQATTEGQRLYFQAMTEAMHAYEAILESQSDLEDALVPAVVLAGSLLISAQAPLATSLATWDAAREIVRPANTRAEWVIPVVSAEAGLYTLRRQWRLNLGRLEKELAGEETLVGDVTAVVGDAGDKQLPDASADAVVWDPPYYDNVDYVRMAGPHAWLPVPIRVRGRGVTQHFDEKSYLKSLRKQAERARDAMREDGGLAIFWPRETSQEMSPLLEILAQVGLEVIDVLRIVDPTHDAPGLQRTADTFGTYILIAGKVGPSAVRATSPVNASRVLELTDKAQPALYAGLAGVLLEHWAAEDVEHYVPASFGGSRQQKVAELVASHTAPNELLRDLGRTALRQTLQRLDQPADGLTTVDELIGAVLGALGFSVPRPAGYSPQAGLLQLENKLADLRLASEDVGLKSVFITLAGEVEELMRFSARYWALSAQHRGWTTSLESFVDAIFPGRTLDRLSLGEWKHIFCKLPAHIAEDSRFESPFRGTATSLRKARLDEALSALVAARNGIVHNKQGFSSLPYDDLQERLVSVSTAAVEKLSRLHQEGRLPVTVRPLEEIRDAFGRRRLVLIDSLGRRYEIFRRAETDLTQTYVFLPSGASPRDVDPILLPLDPRSDESR